MIKLPWSKIEVVPPQDEDRSILADVWFDAENRCLVATDGFILAVVPVEAEESDVGGHVPLEAIKAARRATKGWAYLETRAGRVIVEGQEWERSDLSYPDYKQIVPEPDDEECVTITLDAYRLMQLAEALCEEWDRAKRKSPKHHDAWGVILTFKPDGVTPILVRPLQEPNEPSGRFGVIMPMHGRRGG